MNNPYFVKKNSFLSFFPTLQTHSSRTVVKKNSMPRRQLKVQLKRLRLKKLKLKNLLPVPHRRLRWVVKSFPSPLNPETR